MYPPFFWKLPNTYVDAGEDGHVCFWRASEAAGQVRGRTIGVKTYQYYLGGSLLEL